MINCLVLSACGSTEQQVRSYAQALCGAERLGMTAQVQADHGDTVECYTLEYDYDGSGWTALVTAPDILAGISVHMDETGSSLEYDGVMLAAGDILSKGVTAIGSVPLAMDALRTGSLDSVWAEGELLAGAYVYDDTVAVTLWYDEAGLPVAAELTENGIGKVSCHFTNTEIKDSGNETTDKTNLGGD
jgi:hypothetical protein